MKKAAFVLALVMLLGCAAGCGAAEGEASVQSVSMVCGLGSVGLADRFAGIVSPLGETTIKKDESMTSARYGRIWRWRSWSWSS